VIFLPRAAISLFMISLSSNPGGCAIVVCVAFSSSTVVVYSSMVDIFGCQCQYYAVSVLFYSLCWFDLSLHSYWFKTPTAQFVLISEPIQSYLRIANTGIHMSVKINLSQFCWWNKYLSTHVQPTPITFLGCAKKIQAAQFS
jgi:hypothetical protein